MNGLDLQRLSLSSMLKKLLYLLTFLSINVTNAQIKPTKNSVLNYRVIGFQVPANPKAASYILRVALDSVVNEEYLERRTEIELQSSSNKIIATVPYFNMSYTWQVSYADKTGKIIGKSPISYFKTGYIKYVDSSQYKLRVLKNNIQDKNIFVMLDNSGVMYDLDGYPVWYLPKLSSLDTNMHIMRDLKPTNDGTFTALFENAIYEFDYNGKVLWSGPQNGVKLLESTPVYHHEFTKLKNGHYMVAGNEIIENEMQGDIKDADTGNTVVRNNKRYRKSTSGNILEYDKSGKLVWSWRSSDIFPSNEITGFNNRRISSGTHMNSFYFDEDSNVVYIGFRNISKILKIKYPSGKLIAMYSGKMPERFQRSERAEAVRGNVVNEDEEMFSSQHACRVEKGRVYIFNNNTTKSTDFASMAQIYKEPESNSGMLRKIWSYPCNIDTFTTAGSPTGGSIYPISDTTMLVCTGGSGRVFIVDMKKNLLWNAIPYFKRMDGELKPLPQYRVSYLRKEDLYMFLFK
ncbi:hypothetical protein CAP35_02370 [Chitinophagaceae bacterium IBVUCB1]|nr:hypothetical protein CAP35_02370 [Chitinophagaceae bacterium IBVUCB1]